jgi:hypothetical protein
LEWLADKYCCKRLTWISALAVGWCADMIADRVASPQLACATPWALQLLQHSLPFDNARLLTDPRNISCERQDLQNVTANPLVRVPICRADWCGRLSRFVAECLLAEARSQTTHVPRNCLLDLVLLVGFHAALLGRTAHLKQQQWELATSSWWCKPTQRDRQRDRPR